MLPLKFVIYFIYCLFIFLFPLIYISTLNYIRVLEITLHAVIFQSFWTFYFALVITGCTDGIGKAYTQEVILELNNIVNNKDGY